MSRSGSRNFLQAIGSVARRFNDAVPTLCYGVIKSYDPTTHFVVATIDVGVDSGSGEIMHYDTPPSQLMVPYHGNALGKGAGPKGGEQCLVGVIDAHGDEFIVLGFTSNDEQPGLGVPAGDDWAVSSGALRRIGGTRAALAATNGVTELGAESLDHTEDAIVTKRYVDDVISRQIAQLASDLKTWANASFQGGTNAAPQPTLTAKTTNASSKALAAP